MWFLEAMNEKVVSYCKMLYTYKQLAQYIAMGLQLDS